MLYDYEEIFKIHNRDFSYADIYPEIYKDGFIEKLKTANKEVRLRYRKINLKAYLLIGKS